MNFCVNQEISLFFPERSYISPISHLEWNLKLSSVKYFINLKKLCPIVCNDSVGEHCNRISLENRLFLYTHVVYLIK